MPADDFTIDDGAWVDELIKAEEQTALLTRSTESSSASLASTNETHDQSPLPQVPQCPVIVLPSSDSEMLETLDDRLARASLLLVITEHEEPSIAELEMEPAPAEENLLFDQDSFAEVEDVLEEPIDSIEPLTEHSAAECEIEEAESGAQENSPATEESSNDEFSSLMATFDESDDVPPIGPVIPPSAAAAPIAEVEKEKQQVSCPAGTPSPKISLAALQKSKRDGADEAAGSVARLFGGEAPPPKEPEGPAVAPENPVETAPAPVEKGPKSPAMPLLILDRLTEQVRKSNQHLPLILGALGVLMLAHGIITFVLAGMGWI